MVEEVKDAILIPNAALRYVPPTTTSQPRVFGVFRPLNMGAITTAEPTGHDRRVYVLRDGQPTPVSIEIGATDGVHTVVKSGDLKEGDNLIVDATARK